MDPELSIVIPTRNKSQDVARCIRRLVEMPFSFGIYEIVVVDDGSTEPVELALRNIDTKGIQLKLARTAGKGPACARNEGIRMAAGPIVAFCDDDAIPQPGYLDAIYRPFARDLGSSNRCVVGVEGAVIPVGGENFGLLGMSPRNKRGGVYLTCNIAYRRDVLERIGGLDESFPYPAFEDCDLAAAAKECGVIVWAPDAIVHHPRRKWNLRRAIGEIRFYESLVLIARRYGYLGWPDRPTAYPGLRVYWSAVIALPMGRILRSARSLNGGHWRSALSLSCIAIIQGMAATVLVLPAIRNGYRAEVYRRNYL